MNLATLPGHDLVSEGLGDLGRGVESVPAFLVSAASIRLKALGIAVPTPLPNAAHRLYDLLAVMEGNGAHSKYNALLRRIVSFARAAECVR